MFFLLCIWSAKSSLNSWFLSLSYLHMDIITKTHTVSILVILPFVAVILVLYFLHTFQKPIIMGATWRETNAERERKEKSGDSRRRRERQRRRGLSTPAGGG